MPRYAGLPDRADSGAGTDCVWLRCVAPASRGMQVRRRPVAGKRLLGSPVDLAQQLACARDSDRPIGDQVAPHPVVVTDDCPSIEMRPVAERVTVSHSNDIVPVRDRRSHRSVDAEIGCPSRDQEPIRSNLLQRRFQFGSGEWIVQRLPSDQVGLVALQFGQEFPAGCLRLEIVAHATAMPHKDHCPGARAHIGSQTIDALNDTLQVVLGRTAEKPNLHIHDDDCIHGLPVA